MKKLFFGLIFLTATGILTAQKEDSLTSFTIEKVSGLGKEYDWIKPMIGNWKVQQYTWPKAGANPVIISGIIARRQMMGHFVEEVMEAKPGTKTEAFTRRTYLNYNYANQHWEFIVLDTLYPVLMFETSVGEGLKEDKELTIFLPSFVMPPAGWDKSLAGKLGKQRRTIT
ncbi:MAG: hypothetical protein ABIN67_03180 [Ferruginibacter sp.]